MAFSKEQIIEQLIQLSTEHLKTGDDLDALKDAESIEFDAEQLIIDYCEAQNYLINGFPTEKKLLSEDDEDFDDDYFCQERYRLYLDTLATMKEDVSELMWCYVSNFWKDFYDSKEQYIESLKHDLETGLIYNIEI